MLQFPRDIIEPAHRVMVPAFLGKESRLYTIDVVLAPDRKSYRFRYTRHVIDKLWPDTLKTPQGVKVAGTGGDYLANPRTRKEWIRDLLRLVRASDVVKCRRLQLPITWRS
jgi:hypothetical protein